MRHLYYKFCNIINRLEFKRKGFEYPSSLQISGRIHLCGNGKLILGERVHVVSDWRANPIGGDYSVFDFRGGGVLAIGDYSGVSNVHISVRSEVTIGEHVNIGSGCKIYDHDFHAIDYEARIHGDKDIKTAPVIVKNGAFIGAHTIILKGVTIGEHSVIGAGSVVTKNVPDNEIWAGNPIKFIRKL